MKKMYVYILTNYNNTTLYIGVTNNLIRRTFEHKSKVVEGFTQKYHLNKLVYYEIYEDEITAISREKYLKKAYKKTKVKMITELNPDWVDLYDSIRVALSLFVTYRCCKHTSLRHKKDRCLDADDIREA